MDGYRLPIRVLCSVFLSTVPGLLLSMSPVLLDAESARRIELQIHERVNHERSSRSVPLLNWSDELANEARRHAANIATRHFFEHRDPERGDIDQRLDSSGIRWRRCAENIYAGNFDGLAEEAVTSWRLSPGHYRNMMNSMFVEEGIGMAARQDGTIVVVAEFILK